MGNEAGYLPKHGLMDNDLLFKIVIIGDSAVGKSCLLLRYADDEFSESYINTIGVDFKVKTVEMDGKVIKLSMWDTAGQERFKTLTSTFYRGAHGVMVVFDLTNEDSFQKVQSWTNDVDKFGGVNMPKILVGNKSDMVNKRMVTFEAAKELADQMCAPYIETSAKSSTNVEQSFMTMTAEIKNRIDSVVFDTRKSQTKDILRDGRKIEHGGICTC